MLFKLLALDLDDTLLDEEFHISERNRRAIRRAVDSGVLVTISTGRMFRSALPYAHELGIDLPLITYHGALVRRTCGETLFNQPVPLSLAKDVVALANSFDIHVNAYVNDELYVAEENEFSRFYQNLARVKVNIVGDLSLYLAEEPNKLTIINHDGRLEPLKTELLRRYGDQLSIVISRPSFLEITDRRATKGQALKYLAAMHQIPREQVAAIGDSFNDLDMIQYAGIGVAVANAREEVKAAADIITETNVNHGVAVFIEKYLFNGKEEPA